MDTTTNEAAKCPQYFAAITVCFSGFSIGALIGWNSPAAEMIKANLNLSHPNPWVASVISLAAAASMVVMAFVLNPLGRKLVMLMMVVPFTAGWLVLAFVETIPLYCLGRAIAGFSAGTYTAAVPIFVGEIAQKNLRGRLGIFMQLFIVCGVSYSYNVGSFTNVRMLSLFGMIPILTFAVFFFFIPETPYFYRMKLKPEKALNSLQWYRGKHYDPTEEFKAIEDFVQKCEENEMLSFKAKFCNPVARKALLTGIGLVATQQLCGKNFMASYILTIFKDSNSAIEPKYCQMLVGGFDIFLTVVSMFVIDRAGRKILLMISLTGMSTCHVLIGLYFNFLERDKQSVEGFGWVPLTLLCAFSASFSIGTGPVPIVFIGELFSQEIKAKACSVCFFFRWIFHFLSPYTFPIMVEAFGYGYCFWIYAVICLLALLFVIFFCIETKGKTLQEIQNILSGSIRK